MQKEHFHFNYDSYSDKAELPPWAESLVNEAAKAAEDAYAPYSGFRVGAAVLLENQTVVRGSNQENAAYPSGLCAERVALFAAHAGNPGIKITAVAIYTPGSPKKGEDPVMPCGACRQVIAEYEHLCKRPIMVISASAGGNIHIFQSAADILPFAFTGDYLQK